MRKSMSIHAYAMATFAVIYLGFAFVALDRYPYSMDEIIIPFALVGVAVVAFQSILFVVSRLLRRTDIIDAAWGPSFIVCAFAAIALNPFNSALGANPQTIVTLLVTAWGARLAWHITRRLLKHPEDKRYVELRKDWKGNVALNTYVRIFLVQALLALVISIAVIHINLSKFSELTIWTYAGVTVWLVGFAFESIGDAQLKRHLQKKSGTLMTTGLWRYTRHPNYFGEATMWWGIFIIALGTPYGWIGIITPVVITYLLLFVSGIPMTEKAFEGRTGWAAYKKRTSIFLPLPPKKV